MEGYMGSGRAQHILSQPIKATNIPSNSSGMMQSRCWRDVVQDADEPDS